jgi:hypothetical protein
MSNLPRRDSPELFVHAESESRGLDLHEPGFLDDRVATDASSDSRASLRSASTVLNESALAPVDRGFGAYSFVRLLSIVNNTIPGLKIRSFWTACWSIYCRNNYLGCVLSKHHIPLPYLTSIKNSRKKQDFLVHLGFFLMHT